MPNLLTEHGSAAIWTELELNVRRVNRVKHRQPFALLIVPQFQDRKSCMPLNVHVAYACPEKKPAFRRERTLLGLH
jgi:hypothetical protein